MKARRHGMVNAVAGVAAATTIAAALAGCGGSSLSSGGSGSGGDAATAATVGFLVPKSGVYAPLGTDMENGFRLYLKQKGEKLGGKTITLKVVDEGAGPDTGVPAGQALARDADVKAVAGVVNSAVALGLRDAFQEAKKPLIVANAGADAISGDRSSDYMWRTSFSNGECGASLGKYVASQLKGASAYLMAPDYAAGKEAVTGFEQAFKAAGGTVAGTQLTPFGTTTNFQPYLAAARNSGAKAIFAFYAGSEAVTFVKQYNELGMSTDLPLYGSGFLTEGGVLAAQGKSAVGIMTSLNYSNQLDTATNKTFVDDYTKAYGSAPTVYSVTAYDAAAVLDKALTQGVGGDQIVAGLKAIGTIDSPRGQWKFSEKHGAAQAYYLRKVVEKDGQLVNSVIGDLAKL